MIFNKLFGIFVSCILSKMSLNFVKGLSITYKYKICFQIEVSPFFNNKLDLYVNGPSWIHFSFHAKIFHCTVLIYHLLFCWKSCRKYLINLFLYMWLEIIVMIHAVVFWVVTLCSDVVGHHHFRVPCCLHLWSEEITEKINQLQKVAFYYKNWK
jgi:hypothetical protein